MSLNSNKIKITNYSIIAICISAIFISVLYGFKKLSEIIFLTTFYISILITIYFTYSPYLTRKLIDRQLHNIFYNFDYLISLIKININFDKNKYKNINKHINKYNDNKKIDVIDIKNKKIINKVSKLLIITLITGLFLSFFIWLLTSNFKTYSILLFYKEIVRNNIILLIIIVVIQLLFNTFITKNYIPLENDDIVETIIESINENSV